MNTVFFSFFFLWLSYCKPTDRNQPRKRSKNTSPGVDYRYLVLKTIIGLFLLFPKVSMVDFQLARYGSPALDLVSLLYCCTSAELRKQHMSELLEEYCASIVGFLTQTGCLHHYPDIRERSVKSFSKFNPKTWISIVFYSADVGETVLLIRVLFPTRPN